MPQQTPQQILHLAQNKHWTAIEESKTHPALNEAVKLQSLPVIEAICNEEYDVALRRAIVGKLVSLVPLLVPLRYNINSGSPKQKNRTSLHFAAMLGLDDIIPSLLTAGAYVNVCDEDGNTPAHLACMNNRPSTALLLAMSGAYTVANHSQRSPASLVPADNATAFLPYKMLTQNNSMAKAVLPSGLGTKHTTLIEKGNVLADISTTDVHPKSYFNKIPPIELSLTPIGTFDKIFAICTENKILHLTAKDYIALDKVYCDVYPGHLTEMLKRYGTPNNDKLLVSTAPLNIPIIIKASEDWANIEAYLKIEFDFVAQNASLTGFFLRSKKLHEETSLNKEYFTRNKEGYLLISSKHFDGIIKSCKMKMNDANVVNSTFISSMPAPVSASELPDEKMESIIKPK